MSRDLTLGRSLELGLQPEAEGLLTVVCHRIAPSDFLALEDHFGGDSPKGGTEQDKAERQ